MTTGGRWVKDKWDSKYYFCSFLWVINSCKRKKKEKEKQLQNRYDTLAKATIKIQWKIRKWKHITYHVSMMYSPKNIYLINMFLKASNLSDKHWKLSQERQECHTIILHGFTNTRSTSQKRKIKDQNGGTGAGEAGGSC